MSSAARIAPAEATNPEAAGFVLAGGRSSRMGADKAFLQLHGQPLIAHALAPLRQAGLQASIAGGQPALAAFAPLIEDKHAGQGPLGGICSALAATSALRAVFVSVDSPFLPPSLISLLLHHAEITGAAVTVSSVNGFAQTFPVALHRSVAPALERELASSGGGCFAAFQAAAADLGESVAVVPVELFVQSGQLSHPHALPPAWWFLNANTPLDLHRAEVLFKADIA